MFVLGNVPRIGQNFLFITNVLLLDIFWNNAYLPYILCHQALNPSHETLFICAIVATLLKIPNHHQIKVEAVWVKDIW